MPSGNRCGDSSRPKLKRRCSTSMVRSASRRVAIAVDCAERRPAASARAEALRSADEAPRPTIDSTRVIAPAMITRTTRISSSVNPRARNGIGSVGDVLVLALATFLAIGAERDEVIGLALAGHRVAIVVAPRILEVGFLAIGTGPLVRSA